MYKNETKQKKNTIIPCKFQNFPPNTNIFQGRASQIHQLKQILQCWGSLAVRKWRSTSTQIGWTSKIRMDVNLYIALISCHSYGCAAEFENTSYCGSALVHQYGSVLIALCVKSRLNLDCLFNADL